MALGEHLVQAVPFCVCRGVCPPSNAQSQLVKLIIILHIGRSNLTVRVQCKTIYFVCVRVRVCGVFCVCSVFVCVYVCYVFVVFISCMCTSLLVVHMTKLFGMTHRW